MDDPRSDDQPDPHSPAVDADDESARDGDAVETWLPVRKQVLRDAVGIGVATGAYAVSFGAISTTSGLSVWQTVVLSAVMFSGGSQFGLVGVVAGGGSPIAGAITAVLLGIRNALYGVRLAPVLSVRGARRLLASQLVIDESTAIAVAAQDGPHGIRAGRLGFWATGIILFSLWNLGTLVGALGAAWLPAPTTLGLDAAAPAAFLALLAPRLRAREPVAVALLAALVAVLATPFVPLGIPVLLAAGVAIVAGLRPRRTRTDAPGPEAG
jgi:predicted branched-subunit amino acid permease